MSDTTTRLGRFWLHIGVMVAGVLPLLLTTSARSAPNATESQAALTVARPAHGEISDKRVRREFGFYEPEPLNFDDHRGYSKIFSGLDLSGWSGDPAVWHVEDGNIVGESTRDHPTAVSYLSYRKASPLDFDLKMEIKVEGSGGSGIQYRSEVGKPWKPRPGQISPNLDWMMTGPQADFWYPAMPEARDYSGQFYSENTGAGILAWRGQLVESEPGQYPSLLGSLGNRDALGGFVKINDWNQYLIMARGGTFIHVINGHVVCVYVDDDPASPNNKPGLIGLEIEGYPLDRPMRVSVRNVWLRTLR